MCGLPSREASSGRPATSAKTCSRLALMSTLSLRTNRIAPTPTTSWPGATVDLCDASRRHLRTNWRSRCGPIRTNRLRLSGQVPRLDLVEANGLQHHDERLGVL